MLWSESDPLFPKTQIGLSDSGGFVATGLSREGWSNAGPIRAIFRDAFTGAGLPYFNPHSFRDTLVQLGERGCTTPEQFKAWSQNLGHERVMTTLTSYGTVAPHRQAELIRGMAAGKRVVGGGTNTIDPAFVAQVVVAMRNMPDDEPG